MSKQLLMERTVNGAKIFHLKNDRGATLISILVAASIIVTALGGVGVSAFYLNQAMKKTEVVNFAVSMEANLIAAFHDKANFPDPSQNANSPVDGLRNGTLDQFRLQTEFVKGAPVTLTIPIDPTGTQTGAVGFYDKNFNPCAGFSPTCILRYEVRLRRIGGGPVAAYSFSYQIDINPELLKMAPLGGITVFNSPIDPGYYRAGVELTKCNSATDLFMTGMNRDTGEAYCAEKPTQNKCPDGQLPKGLVYLQYQNGDSKAGTLKLDCTANPMRTINCPVNYSLHKFNPQYADPENNSFGEGSPIGECVFRTKDKAVLPGSFPPNPTAPYLRSVSGTFCPVFYQATNMTNACHLVPNSTRNNSEGRGRCASTAYKNCTRYTYTTSWVDNMWAWNAWNTDCNQKKAMVPPQPCYSEPAKMVLATTCSKTETSTYCSGSPDADLGCATKGSWSGGTPYATNIQDTYPTANAVGTPSGRGYTCTFQDTSASCSAPDTDFNGNVWGKKNPKWYGGVQVSGLTCTLTEAQLKNAF